MTEQANSVPDSEEDLTTDNEVVEIDDETGEEAEVNNEEAESPEGGQAESEKAPESQDKLTVYTEEPDDSEESEESDDEAPGLVNKLRRKLRETAKENKELRRKFEEPESSKPAKTLRPKPKIADHEYDSEAFEADLEKWYSEKQEVERDKAERDNAAKQEQEAWQQTLNRYAEQKSQIKRQDFADIEQNVLGSLSQTQQGILVEGAENAANVILALNQNPDKLDELADITNPVKFAFAVAKLEGSIKVASKRKPPPPERPAPTGAPKSVGGGDKHLDKLRAEAEKTGDYTKVHQYKQQLKAR